MLNAVLTEIYHLKKESAVKYSRKNDGIKPFESGGDASLEFFSLKTDCSIILVRIIVNAQYSKRLNLFICLIS